MAAAPSLAESGDVSELIPGSLPALSTAVDGYRDAAEVAQHVATLLGQAKVHGWSGDAADEFHASLAKEPPKWRAAAQALASIADALEDYLVAFRSARVRADDAVQRWRTALQLSASAQRAWEEETRERVLRIVPGHPLRPAFADPGVRARAEAEELLADARRRLNAVGDETVRLLVAAECHRPDTSNGWERFWGWIGENVVPFPGKVVEGAVASEAELLSALLTLDIDDLWAGLGELFRNPSGVAKAVIDEEIAAWTKDPANALGADLLALATVGLGSGLKAAKLTAEAGKVAKAADAAAAAKRAAELSAKAALASRLREQFEMLAQTGARPYGDLKPSEWFEKYYKGPLRDPEGRVVGANWDWPEYPGWGSVPGPNTLKPGQRIDRLTPIGYDKGEFASPVGTPFEQRALPPDRLGSGFETATYEVIRPLLERIEEGLIAPWFGQSGMGLQYYFPGGVEEYVKLGYLRVVRSQE